MGAFQGLEKPGRWDGTAAARRRDGRRRTSFACSAFPLGSAASSRTRTTGQAAGDGRPQLRVVAVGVRRPARTSSALDSAWTRPSISSSASCRRRSCSRLAPSRCGRRPARPGGGHGSRQQLPARPGQAQAGDVARGGAGGDEHRHRAARARLPEGKSPYPRATVHSLRDQVPAQNRLMLVGLAGASFCVLLIACTNLASLLLTRASGGARSWRCGRRWARGASGSCASC